MPISSTLALIYGSVLLVMGLSMFNKNCMQAVMQDLSNSRGLLWIAGLFTFVSGLVSVSLYNVWTSDWRVAVTILGYLVILKGLAILLLPQATISSYRKAWVGSLPTIAAVVAVILGVVGLYLGFAG